MASHSIDRQLSELEAARDDFSKGSATRILKLIRALDHSALSEPRALIRFHEALLFLRAFPQSASVLRSVERLLTRFHKKVAALRRSGADMSDFDTYEHSGIAGTSMEDTLSFDVARWLVRRLPGKVEIAWDSYEPGRELGTTGPRFMPLLEDDAFVEADTPWREWLTSAASKSLKGGGTIPAWLITRFEALPLSGQQQAELYESLRVPLRWEMENSPVSRTRNWRATRKVFYHDRPLITRSQVSLRDELARRPPGFTRLAQGEGGRIVEFIREVMLVRYRELYGTTLADGRSVVRVDLGASSGSQARTNSEDESRGLEIYLWNLPPERRLPLRAYLAGFTLKNGVPINYIEAIGLCEWMEVGFNTFYTFRGGEAGWIYAQVLRALCAFMGTTIVSIYPYQLGHDNDEAIESGAFWFYRKLGFRPGRAELLDLVKREEKKIAASDNAQNKYRTPARTLKRLAAGHVFYDLPGAGVGAWDRFSTRNIGLQVNRRMGSEFAGDAERMREQARRALERALRTKTASWSALDRSAFDNFALVLAYAPELRSWTTKEKEDLVRIIRAKSKADEMTYLHLTQRHLRLRDLLLRLGSEPH
ncbi:MAG: hypothetical protein WB817_04310 [Terriglobales bacterium]